MQSAAGAGARNVVLWRHRHPSSLQLRDFRPISPQPESEVTYGFHLSCWRTRSVEGPLHHGLPCQC